MLAISEKKNYFNFSIFGRTKTNNENSMELFYNTLNIAYTYYYSLTPSMLAQVKFVGYSKDNKAIIQMRNGVQISVNPKDLY